MHFSNDDQLYYLFLTFNKIELDKHDIQTLYKLGYCPNCLFKFKNKIINDKEIEYINTKNWDEFLDKYPMKLNQCNCTNMCIVIVMHGCIMIIIHGGGLWEIQE